MSLRIAIIFAFISVAWILASCSNNTPTTASSFAPSQNEAGFYAREGREAKVVFYGVFISPFKTVEEFQSDLKGNTVSLELWTIPRAMRFLIGPLSYRKIGMVRDFTIQVDPHSAYMTRSGTVGVHYKYEGTWLLNNSINQGSFQLPVPFNLDLLKTEKWLLCTDQSPQHQNDAFYFYYWDPSRKNCDQKERAHYKMATVVYQDIDNQKKSYPEYDKLINSGNQKNNLQMTFAFGYMAARENADPYTDNDGNMNNFRTFLGKVRELAKTLSLEETPIFQSEYLNPLRPEVQIGSRFVGSKNGVRLEIKVVADADVEAMDLFAKSYAHDHDAFFGWFGHSRVGSQTDINNFRFKLDSDPEFYQISRQYQIIYWGGCTSYAYYVKGLAEMKENGTKGLDLVTTGFSSLFTPFPDNAKIWMDVLTNWEKPTSYQKIVSDLEQTSTKLNRALIVNVIGDEDNSVDP